MKHCNKELKIQSGKSNGKTLYYAECEVCGLQYKDMDGEKVKLFFSKDNIKNQHSLGGFENNKDNFANELQLTKMPEKKRSFFEMIIKNENMLIDQSAVFQDKKATKRMFRKNVRYASNLVGKSWEKLWNTEEGQESISHALEEANSHAATLGDMGDLVPFGNSCEFIANVECYKFALETGKNAPFKYTSIDLIYENDDHTNDQVDGNFIFTLKRGIPRGEVEAVVVQGVRTDNGKNIGEIYDASRLVEKAAQHSPSYKNYLMDIEQYTRLESEGNLKTDANGHKYFEKTFDKYGGGTWSKKIYEHDLINPYEGPDRPEMLRKSAGKSFFRPYMKVRNASAMAAEWSEDENITDDMSRDDVADSVLNQAMSQFENVDPPIKDADVVEEKEEKEVVENQEELFNADKGLDKL